MTRSYDFSILNDASSCAAIKLMKFLTMRRAYRKRPNPHGDWGLLLLPPEDDLDQFEADEIPVAFAYCSEKFSKNITAYRVISTYSLFKGEIDEISNCICEAFPPALDSQEECLMLEDVLKTVFMENENEDMDRELFQRLTTSVRASIAFHVATWAALAWQTQWCHALCSCSIRQTRTLDGQGLTAVNPCEAHVARDCSAAALYDRPYLLLGVLLAELALAQPIGVCIDHDNLRFELHGLGSCVIGTKNTSPATPTVRMALPEILQRVKNATSPRYRMATNHCFTLDWHQSHGTRPNSRGALHVADYESYLEKILQPLSKYDKTLQGIQIDL